MMFLSLSCKCWHYMCVPPCLPWTFLCKKKTQLPWGRTRENAGLFRSMKPVCWLPNGCKLEHTAQQRTKMIRNEISREVRTSPGDRQWCFSTLKNPCHWMQDQSTRRHSTIQRNSFWAGRKKKKPLHLQIKRAHQALGRKNGNRSTPRNIALKFLYFKDKEIITHTHSREKKKKPRRKW